MEAVSDLIKHWRWNRVFIVYVEIESILFFNYKKKRNLK